MDLDIIQYWIIGVLIYILLQIVFLRRISRYKALVWQSRIAFTVAALSFIFTICCSASKYQNFWVAIFTAFIVTFLVLLFIVVYLLSVYSYLESSVTLRIFAVIGRNINNSISEKKLTQAYGIKQIVERRIVRFLALKIIDFDGKVYRISDKVGAFQLREKLVAVLKSIFP